MPRAADMVQMVCVLLIYDDQMDRWSSSSRCVCRAPCAHDVTSKDRCKLIDKLGAYTCTADNPFSRWFVGRLAGTGVIDLV